MRSIRFGGVICAAALLAAIAVSASAAKPKSGQYADIKGQIAKITLDVNKKKNKVTPSYYNDCSPVPVIYKTKIKPSGKFSFSGKAKNVIDDKITIELKGKFVSKKKAKGTVTYSAGGCKGKAESFVAKYQKGS